MEEEFIYTVYDLTKMFNVSSAIFYSRVSKLKLNTPMYSRKIYNNKAKREIHHFNQKAVDILKEEFNSQKQEIDPNFKYSAKDFMKEFSISRNILNLYLKEIFEEKGEKFKEENKQRILIENEKSSNLTFLYTKEVYDLLEEKRKQVEKYENKLDILEEIKQSYDIVEIVSQYVALNKNNGNYLGLCPFCYSGTPSLSVSPTNQTFYCSICKTRGNVITFISKIEKIPLREAIRILAEKIKNKDIEENKDMEEQKQKNKTLTQNQIEEIEHLFYDKVKSIDKISETLKIDKEKVRSVLSKNFYKTEEKENKENRKEVKNMEEKKAKTKALSLNDLLKIFDFKTQGVHIYKDDFRYSLDSTENKEFTNEKFISTFKEDILDSEIIKIVSRSDKNIIDIYLK